MKNFYTFMITVLFSILTYAQDGYRFGIEHISGHNFKIVAVPNFTDASVDISDIGFTLMLPAGSDDVANLVPLLGSRTWDLYSFDATFLSGLGLGDGTKDAFQFNLPPGVSVISHTDGVPIDLVSFDITNSPTTGEMYFLLNSDPIAMGAGGVLDSFMEVNVDGSGTGSYFLGLASGMEDFMFSVLSVKENELLKTSISIYPNPASDFININSTIEIDKIKLFDLLGKQVLLTSETEQIDISSLPVGVYLLKVFFESGNIAKKVIIE